MGVYLYLGEPHLFIWENWSPWFDYFDYMPWTLDCISISCDWAGTWAELVVFSLPFPFSRRKLDTPSHGLVVSTLKKHFPRQKHIWHCYCLTEHPGSSTVL